MAGPCLAFLEDEMEKEAVHSAIFTVVCHLAESTSEIEAKAIESLATAGFRFLTDARKQRKIQHSAAEALIALAKRNFDVVMTQIIDGLSPSEVPNIEVFWALKEITELSFTKLAPHLSPVSPPFLFTHSRNRTL